MKLLETLGRWLVYAVGVTFGLAFVIPMVMIGVAAPFWIFSPWDPEPWQVGIATAITGMSTFLAYCSLTADAVKMYGGLSGRDETNIVYRISKGDFEAGMAWAVGTVALVLTAIGNDYYGSWIAFAISSISIAVIIFGVRHQKKQFHEATNPLEDSESTED